MSPGSKVYHYKVTFPCSKVHRHTKPLVPKRQDGDWADWEDVYFPECLDCEACTAVLAGVAICRGVYSYSPAGWGENGGDLALPVAGEVKEGRGI